MRRYEVLRSTAFRLALAFSGLFLVTFVVAGFFTYKIITTDLQDRLDRNLTETFDLISGSYNDSDVEDLIGTIATYAASSQNHARVFYLADANGKVLAGNVSEAALNPGVSTVAGSAFALGKDSNYRARRGTIAGNTLVVATSFEETKELAALSRTSFGWAGAIAAAIAVASGILIAGVVRKRMDVIAGTMSRVGQGELGARIPLRGSDDDLNVLSGQINAALDRLSALVEGMRQVSVDIAHDLKTPLNRLSINIEEALEKAERSDDNVTDLLQARAETDRINATFEALLRIAQLESGARRERFVDVSLGSVLSALLEAYEEVANEAGQTLTLNTEPGAAGVVRGDRDLLIQLFANLIENAIRHAGKGASIDISFPARSRSTSVCIADNGPGIPDEEREKVFQRLYRLEKSRTTEGTGLGLSMAKAIVVLHGASIELASANPGLSVTIQFPLIDGPPN